MNILEETVGRLQAACYHWPDAHCTAALAATQGATTPAQVVAAITAYMDRFAAGRSLIAYKQPPADRLLPPDQTGNAVLAARARGFGNDPQYHFPPNHHAEQTRARVPDPAAPSADAAATAMVPRPPWNPHTHPACRNWRLAREGCDGSHHLPHCPLPRLVGVVGSADGDYDDAAVTPAAAPAAPTLPVGGALIDMDDPGALRDFSLMIGRGDGPTDFAMPTSRPVLTLQLAPTGIQDSIPCKICEMDEPVCIMPPIADTFDSMPSYVCPSYMGALDFV